jgi:hypothetical protein
MYWDSVKAVLLLNWDSDAKSMEAVSTKSQDMRALKLVLYQVILYRSQEVRSRWSWQSAVGDRHYRINSTINPDCPNDMTTSSTGHSIESK